MKTFVSVLLVFLVYGLLGQSVTSVNSSTPNGTYVEGQMISIQVNFNAAVQVPGSPQLTLSNGAIATFGSGSGSTTLNFNYLVGAGESSTDLGYASTGALGPIGSITDNATGLINANLTLPVPGGSNSLSANKNLVVDAVLPTFQNAHFFDTNGDGDIDEVVIEMSEPVDPLTAESFDFTLTGGTISGVELSGPASNTLDDSDVDEYVTLTASLTGTGTANIDYDKAGAGGSLQLQDLAGNEADNDATITEVDVADPVVLDVTSADADNTYIVGQTISIDVSFSENVTALGTPQLTLETGSTDADVDLSSGSGSSTLTFDYEVSSGESSGDLNYQSINALSEGTSIRDGAGNDAVRILPALAGAGSLATNKNFVIDGVEPTVVNVTSPDANNTYIPGQSITIQVVFDDIVTVTGTPTITLETGTSDAVVNLTTGSGTNTISGTYLVGAGEETLDLDYVGTGSLTAGTSIQDANGNDAVLTLASPGASGSLGDNKTIVIDGILPTFQNAHFFDTNGDGDIDEVVIEMSEPVDPLTAESFDFTLTGGTISGVELSGPASNTLDDSDVDEYVTLTASLTGTGTANIDYDKAGAGGSLQLQDLAGNEADNDATITEVDVADPVVLDVTSADADNTYIVGQTISIDVSFSENVTALGTPQLTLETGSTDADVDLSSGSGSSTLTFDYEVSSGESSGDLNYQSINALSEGTSIRDGAGNDAVRILPALAGAGSLATNKNFVIDGVEPTVVNVTSPDANNTYIPGQSITIQVVFDDIVTVTGTPTITLETGTSDAVVNLTTGSGTNTISGTYLVGAGEETLDLDYVGTGSLTAGTSIQDANGNDAVLTLASPGASGSLGDNKTIVIDGILPTFQNAHFFDTNGDGDIDEVVIEMSEPVDPNTAESFDFDLAGGMISGVELSGPASNTLDDSDVDEYVTLTASLTGTGTANIDYDKAGAGGSLQLQDLAGNEADNDATITEVDVAAPIIIDAVTTENVINGRIDRLILTFSESIDDGNSGAFTSTTVDVDGYTGEAKVSGDDDNAEAIISFSEGGTPDTDNTPSITLLAGQVEDGSMNSITSPQIFSGTEDGADPVIVAAITLDDDLNGEIDGMDIELSEPIDDSGSTLDQTTFDLASPYNNNDPDAETGDTGNDEFVRITFNEESTPDTDATPNVTLNSNKIEDQSPASNVLGSNETFSGTVDGAVPVLLLSTTSPAEGGSNITINSARTVSFDFSEDIDPVVSNSISLFNTNDLVNPLVSADVTDASVTVVGSTVTWNQNELLEKGDTYAVGIDAGAFEDQSPGTLPNNELLNTGDGKWEWSMVNTGSPRFVYSPQQGLTNIPPFARIYFYFDEPVRIQNSADDDMDADIIDSFGGSKDSDEFSVDIDNDDGQPGSAGGTAPASIYPLHIEPPVPGNFSKEKIFDVSDESYNSGNGYKTSGSPIYRLSFTGSAFEDDGDSDSDAFTIEFQIDGSDATRPFVSTYVPAPATINVDIETTTSIVINFNEPVTTGFGDIRLFANLNPDVLALDIPASSPLVSVVGSQVTIDISGVTLAGNVEYYVNFDKGAFVDIAGNTNVGISDETTWNFTTEAEFNAPEISSLTPADNATGVSVDQDLTIVFDEPVQEGAGGNLNVRLSSNGFIVETIPSSSFTFDGNDVTIPLAQLGGLSGYYINIDNTAIADLGNNAFPGITGSFAWSFTTGAEAVAPSAITSTFSPADMSSGASVRDDISFFFDEVVSPRAGNFIEIRESGGALIESFDVTASQILVSGNQVVINPTADLAFVTEYYVTVDAGAFEDASGNLSNAVGGDGNWNFTTGADASNPFVLTLSPNDDATGVSLSPIITIGFSESVTDQGSGVVNLLYTDGTVAHSLDLSDFIFSDDLNPAINLATIPGPITLSGNTEYFVEIPNTAFEDLSGLPFAGIAGNGNWSFTTTVDATAPIPSGTPTGTGVAVTTDLIIDFPEPVVPNSGSITLLYTDMTVVETVDVSAAEASNGNTRYTIELSDDLSGGVEYYVDVDLGAFVDNTGLNSTAVVGMTDWSFTTADDGVAPVILSLTPANDDTDVSTASASLVLTFDEPVDVGSGNIQLSYNDGVVIETFNTGDITFSSGNTVATVDPYGVLDGQTEYYVEVDNGFFEDNDGSPNGFSGITGDGSWSFFTGDDLIAPSPTPPGGGVMPAAGTSGNPVDPTITITLDERVNAGSGVITISTPGQTVSINVLDGTQISGFGTNIITINPSESLINGENYTVTVPVGAFEDPTGNSNGLITWSFEVGNATIVTASNTIICTNQDFVPLDDLIITETSNDDFLVGTAQTLVITLPAQFEFNTALTPNVSISGSDLSAASAIVDFNTMTITYTTDGQSGTVDEMTVSNVEVQYLGSAVGIFNTLRTGGTGNMKGNNVVHGQPHFIFSVNDPPAPPTLNATFWQGDGSEDILVPASVPGLTVTATGPGILTWYNNDFSESVPATTGVALPYTSLPPLNSDNSFGTFDLAAAEQALYTFYVTSNNGICESDGFKRNILVLDYIQSPGGLNFVGDVNEVTFTVSEPDDHLVTYTGPALIDELKTAGQSTIKFSPSAAGAGSFLMEIITTNNLTNESVILPRPLTVTATADIFGGTDLDIDYCETDGILSFEARLDDIPVGQIFYGFSFDNIPITPAPVGWSPDAGFPGVLSNPTTGWQINLDTIAPGPHRIERLVVEETSTNPALENFVFLSADLNVYTNPTVEINDLPEYFCQDDIPFDLRATVTNTIFESSVVEDNIVNVTSYFIEKLVGATVVGSATIGDGSGAVQFDPTNPLNLATPDPVGRYRITYTSIADDDPNFPTAANSKGCINADTRIIEVLATPELPEIITDLTGIGSESLAEDRINLQFCVGDVVPNIEAMVALDESITWYRNSSLTTTYNGTGAENNILEAEELFGTDRPNSAFDITIFATKTSFIDIDGMGYTGCESPPIVINIRVYEDPTIPVIDVSADAASQVNLTSYLFEYCDDYGVGEFTFSSLLPDDEAYYNIYDESNALIGNFSNIDIGGSDVVGGTIDFSDVNITNIPGTSTTVFIARVLNDSTFVDSGAQFAGCTSDTISLTVNVYDTSDPPPADLFTNERTDYYLCSGDYLGTITSPAEANTRYEWYRDFDNDGVPDDTLNIAAFDNRFALHEDEFNNEIELDNINISTSDTTYYYLVTQIRDFNDVTGFVGCESSTTQLTITVFPDPGSPEFNAPVSTSINRDDVNTQFLQASYCQGRITGTEEFVLNGNVDAVFNWYRANPLDSSIVGNIVHSHLATDSVTSSQLKISDSEQDTLYFVVSQVNNIVTDMDNTVFEGCETEKQELAFVTFYVYDIPSRPQTTTGSFEFCEDAVFANGIELTGEAGVTYRWYRDDDDDGNPDVTHFFEGQVAQATDLALLNENGTGDYQFWVTQTQNIGDGVNTFEGCASDFQPITVFEVPPVVSTIEFEPAYCVDVLGNNTVIIDYQGVPNAVFTWYDESLNVLQSSPGLFFDTDENTIGTYSYFISQTFNNCESELTEVTFTIFPVPETPTFDLASNVSLDGSGDYEFIYCRDEDISDEILFIDNSQDGFIYEWYFDELLTEPLNIQGADPEDAQIAFTNLGIGGNTAAAGSFDRFVRSRVGTCFSNVREFDITIGEAPVVAFTWEGLTKAPEGSTEFAFYNENPAVQDDEIQEIRFSIGESVVNADLNPGGADLSNYTHNFLDSGKYQVELFMRTSEVCRDSVERVVEILDVVTVPAEGYLQTFENVDHGWFDEERQDDGRSDGRKSSWEMGQPIGNNQSADGPQIVGAFSGNNAWVTDLDSTYQFSEFSWVYSPAFDISALPIPVVSFFHQHYFPNNRDGVVFQFSDDNGATWNTLGRLDEINADLSEPSGRNWYDGGDIPTVPGDLKINEVGSQRFNSGGFGWTTSQGQDGWLETIHILENFDRSSLIRFRFALSSSQGDEDEGFAFDDFRLYNSDKITLLESFLNASEAGAKAAFEDLASRVDERAAGSVAWITYFTDLDASSSSGRDEINRANSEDPSARVGYYGINEVPSSALEGEVRKLDATNANDPFLPIRGFTRASLTIAGLESKKFDIQLSKNDAPGDILSVTGTFTAEEDLADAELSIRFIVIEKEVTGIEIGEFTQDDVLRNVLRKILPSAAGIVKIGDVTSGQVFTETVEWKISNVYDPSQLDVFAFIQNENASNGKREIYQTAILNGDFSDKQLILSVFDQLRNGDPFVIYPNPVDDEFKLEILNPVKEAMDWTIFDQTGREVLRGQVPGGETSVDISTKRLPSGLFLLQLIHNDILFEPKRIIVVHE